MADNIGFRETHDKLRDTQTGSPAMRQLVEDAKKFEAVSWMVIALNQLFDPAMDNSHLPRAERFAIGDKLSEQILSLNPPQGDGPLKFRWYVPVVQYHYESGNKDRAIELIEVALKSLGRRRCPTTSNSTTLPHCSKLWPTTRVRTPVTWILCGSKTRLLEIKAQSPDEQRSQRDHKWNGAWSIRQFSAACPL